MSQNVNKFRYIYVISKPGVHLQGQNLLITSVSIGQVKAFFNYTTFNKGYFNGGNNMYTIEINKVNNFVYENDFFV